MLPVGFEPKFVYSEGEAFTTNKLEGFTSLINGVLAQFSAF